MTIRPFRNSCWSARTCDGPLAPYLEAFAALLQEQGYSHEGARNQLLAVTDFSGWLRRRQLAVADIAPHIVARYVAQFHQRRHRALGNRSALRKLLALLHEQGLDEGSASPARAGESDDIEQDFKRYLSQERGLSPATLLNYLPVVHQFLKRRGIADLSGADVTGFVQRHAHQLSPGRAKLMTTALRSFLRYLQQRGEIETDLAACVPCVPRWSLSGIPKFLPAGQMQQVLEHCDRHTVCGIRDYAMLLLLARLGLRACEVVSLNLDDIDWRQGMLLLRGKGKRWAQLPLPQEVGDALACYLQQARPRCATRRVFIRQCAPRVGFANSSAICCVVERALLRAGIDSPRKGAHLFRHTLATDMLRRGASLSEIGQLLRHRHPSTTTIYAKVDLSALRLLAVPWPGAGR